MSSSATASALNGRWGIFTASPRDLLIEDNETSYSRDEHGIYVSNSGDRVIVRRNHAHHNSSAGIQLNADPAQMGDDPTDPQGDGIIEDALIEANLIHDNGAGGGAAINLASVRTSLIRNNVLYGNHATGIAGWDDGDGSNQFGTRDNRIIGNTIVQASDGRFAISLLNGSTGNVVEDNILLHLGTRGSVWSRSVESGAVCAPTTTSSSTSSPTTTTSSPSRSGARCGFDANSLVATATRLCSPTPPPTTIASPPTSPARDRGASPTDLPTDRDGVRDRRAPRVRHRRLRARKRRWPVPGRLRRGRHGARE